MKKHAMLGFILMVAGIVILAYQGIACTRGGNRADRAPILSAPEGTRSFPQLPIAGGLALAGGIAVLVTGSRKGEETPKRPNRRWLR
ncbi:MAG: DUF3185 domain-containing protein [Nitrospirota bacterium]